MLAFSLGFLAGFAACVLFVMVAMRAVDDLMDE